MNPAKTSHLSHYADNLHYFNSLHTTKLKYGFTATAIETNRNKITVMSMTATTATMDNSNETHLPDYQNQ